MLTDAVKEFARDEILEACRETYQSSPAAWVGWERSDLADVYDAIENAARELVAEGLIQATFDETGNAVEAQLTEAGAKFLKLR